MSEPEHQQLFFRTHIVCCGGSNDIRLWNSQQLTHHVLGIIAVRQFDYTRIDSTCDLVVNLSRERSDVEDELHAALLYIYICIYIISPFISTEL